MSRRVKNFVDRLRIYVKSGAGSPGNPKIKGKGGNGGSVILRCEEAISLTDMLSDSPKRRFIAENGLPASSRKGSCFGTNAKDIEVKVPVGISVSVHDPGQESRLIGDLNEPGQKIVIAQGGNGGIPVTNYLGTPGEAHSIVLDLKLMADVGLIGLPNAGKSSLLQALSGAKAKIASYPFTTLKPQVAQIKYHDNRLISMTDLPGLADIAARFGQRQPESSTESEEPPLRHTAFLKHVERTSCILLVLDALGFQANQHSPLRSPLASAMLLVSQLQRYSYGRLLGKPLLCDINKIDLPYAEEAANETRESLLRISSPDVRKASGLPAILLPRHDFHFEEVYLVSAKQRKNLSELKEGLREWLDVIEMRRRREDLEEAVQQSRRQVDLALGDTTELNE